MSYTACKWDKKVDLEALFNEYKRIIKPNGTICIFGNNMFSAELMMAGKSIYRYSMVWVKPNSTSPLLAKIQPLRRYEDILVFYKHKNIYNPQFSQGEPYKWAGKRSGGEATRIQFEVDLPIENKDGKRYPTNVLEFAREIGAKHSTGKPTKLMEYLIRTYTNEDMLVLDTFAGTCSTAIGAIRSNRNYLCFEKDGVIYNNGVERVKEYGCNDDK